MSPRSRKRARDIAEALFSTQAGPPATVRLTWSLDELDDLVTRSSQRVRLAFYAALWFVSWLVPALAWRAMPLGRLDPNERVRVLERAEQGLLSPLIVVIKTLLCLVWFEHPASAAELGYDDPTAKVQP